MVTEPNEFIQKLQELQDSTEVTYTTLPSDEPRFIIDANSRTITVPPEFQFLGVKNDHKAETVYFEIDRYFDAMDLSTQTCVIQFSNNENSGFYPVTSMDTVTVDGKIIFGWEILNDVTAAIGNISFSVRFYTIDESNQFTYNFNTLTVNSVILDTLDVDNSEVFEKYPSELEVWLDRMNELEAETSGKVEEIEAKGQEVLTEINTVKNSIPEDYSTLSSDVDGLINEVSAICGVLEYSEDEHKLNLISSYPKDNLPDVPYVCYGYLDADIDFSSYVYLYINNIKVDRVSVLPENLIAKRIVEIDIYMLAGMLCIEISPTDRFNMDSYIEHEIYKLRNDYKASVDGLKSDIVNVNGGENVLLSHDNLEILYDNYYLDNDTNNREQYNNFAISKSYFVPQGYKVVFEIGAYGLIAVAETDENQSFYKKIANTKIREIVKGSYVAEKDTWICFSWYKVDSDKNHVSIYEYKSKYVYDIYKNVLDIDKASNEVEVLHNSSYIDLYGNKLSDNDYSISKSYFLKKGETIRFRMTVWGTTVLAETDENQTFYKPIISSKFKKLFDELFTANKDMYICFCWTDVYLDGAYYCKSSLLNYDVNHLIPSVSNDGLNILVFGDSITDCTNITISDGKTSAYSFKKNSFIKDGITYEYDMWAVLMQNYLPIKEVRSYAKSGAVYRDRMTSEEVWEERQQLSEQINLAFNDLNNPNGVFNQSSFNPDYVIFALGINDRWDTMTDDDYELTIAKNVYNDDNSLNIEATLNALDRTNFSDSIRWAYLKTKAKFPYAQFITVLPIQTGNVENEMYLNVRNRIKKMAERHSIKVLDGGYEMGVFSELNDVYLKDGLHPNKYGQNLYTKFIVNAIKSTYIKDDFLNK